MASFLSYLSIAVLVILGGLVLVPALAAYVLTWAGIEVPEKTRRMADLGNNMSVGLLALVVALVEFVRLGTTG